MPVYIALFRAINLGPHHKLRMTDLRALGEQLGLENVRTVVQSGNLVFEHKNEPAARLETQLEKAAKRVLGLDTPVFVRTVSAWRAAVDANPFVAEAKKDPAHLLMMSLKKKPAAAHVKALVESIPGRERAKLVGRELYLVYPDGIGTSKLTPALIEKRIATRGTARNWNTVHKLLDLAGA